MDMPRAQLPDVATAEPGDHHDAFDRFFPLQRAAGDTGLFVRKDKVLNGEARIVLVI